MSAPDVPPESRSSCTLTTGSHLCSPPSDGKLPLAHSDQDIHDWLAVTVKYQFECVVSNHLRHRGYQTFVPVYRARRQWSDRVKTIEIPLFPGYVFCRPDLGAQMPIDAVPGVTGVVTFGARRAAVDHWELEAIRAVLTKGMVAQPWPFLKMGRKVAVERGPLKGVAGIIVRDKDLYRLVLSVTLLNSSIAVEIDRDWVSPMD